MIDNNDFLNQIDSFLNNKMTHEEASHFEELMERDPLLKSTMSTQERIINGIRESRRMELKNRLNNISIIPFYQTLGFKAVAGVTAFIILATFSYFSYQYNEPNYTNHQKLEATQLNDGRMDDPFTNEFYTSEPTLTLIKDPIGSSSIEKPEAKKKRKKEVVKEEIKKNSTVTPTSNKQTKVLQVDIPSKNSIYLAEIVNDADESFEHDITFNDFDDDALPNFSIADIDKPIVEIKKETKHKFHYQFYNNKLILHGNFEGKYRLVEVQEDSNSKYYLSYDENFYSIKENQEKIVPLRQIRNKGITESLKARL